MVSDSHVVEVFSYTITRTLIDIYNAEGLEIAAVICNDENFDRMYMKNT